MIKTYGERGDSWLGRKIKHELKVTEKGIISSKNIPCESEFVLENTELRFDGPEENYRPWMEFSGYIECLRGNFPCGIEEIKFSEKKRFDSRFRYDFSNDELAELAKKGLFSKGYAERGLNEPDIFFKGNVLEFPVIVDVNILKDKNGPHHAVFVDINNRHYMEIDAISSGYTEGFAQHYADLGQIEQLEEENQDKFIKTDYIEKIGDIELLDIVPENSHILSLDDEEDDDIYDMDIDIEEEISLFEKYNIEEDVNERNRKYEKYMLQRAQEYQIEQEALSEAEQEVVSNETKEDGRLLDFDISIPETDKRKQIVKKKRQNIAEQQQKEIQQMNEVLENMQNEMEEVQQFSADDFDFM